MSASTKSTAYVYGLIAGFEGLSFGSTQTAFDEGIIESEEELSEWQIGWCDAHEIRVSLGAKSANCLRAALQALP